jgi:hypothetical protein
MAREYNPDGYEQRKPMVEKILFSAPEYFVYETRLGGWIAVQLQRTLDFLNRGFLTSIPSRTNSYTGKAMRSLSHYISRILGWLNYLFEKKQREGKRN